METHARQTVSLCPVRGRVRAWGPFYAWPLEGALLVPSSMCSRLHGAVWGGVGRPLSTRRRWSCPRTHGRQVPSAVPEPAARIGSYAIGHKPSWGQAFPPQGCHAEPAHSPLEVVHHLEQALLQRDLQRGQGQGGKGTSKAGSSRLDLAAAGKAPCTLHPFSRSAVPRQAAAAHSAALFEPTLAFVTSVAHPTQAQ